MESTNASFPLSNRQQQVWISHRLHPNLPLYHIVFSFRIQGPLDPKRFEQALRTVTARVDALRMVVRTDPEGHPYIEILPDIEPGLKIIDRRNNWDPSPEGLETFLNRFVWLPFILEERLFQTWLFRTGVEEYIWVLKMHHIVSDGVTFQLLYDHIADAYASPDAFRPCPPYRPAATEEPLEDAAAYWNRKFAAGAPAANLFGRTDEGRAHPMERFTWALPESLLKSVDSLNKGQMSREAHRFTFFASALMLFLSRYGDSLTPAMSMVYHGRRTGQDFRTAGFYTRMLPLQIRINREDTLRDLLDKVEAEARAARLFSAVPPGSAQANFPQASVNLHTSAFRPFCGMPVQVLWHQSGWNENSLVLNIHSFNSESCELELAISQTLIDSEARRSAADRFHALLYRLFTNPNRAACQAAGLSEADQQIALQAWQGPERPLSERSIPIIFEELAVRHPGQEAFRFESRSVDYGTLNVQANRLAHRLIRRTGGERAAVGIHIAQSLDLPMAVLAVLKSGCPFVMLPPDLPEERLAAMLSDADVRTVITAGPEAGPFSAAAILDVRANDLSNEPDSNPGVTLPLAAPLYIAYTSGSTGRPKGIRIPQRQLLEMLTARQETCPLESGDVVCHKSHTGFVDSTIELFHGLLNGVPTVILPDHILKDPERLVLALAQSAVTRVRFVPDHLKTLIEIVPDIDRRLPRLKEITSSAAELKPGKLMQFFDALPGRRFLNTYGLTEVLSVSFCELTVDHLAMERLPIGRPIPNRTVYILDRFLQPLPPGIPGELYLGGDDLPDGYIGLPEENAHRFLPDPFRPGHTVFRTGDLAGWGPDGQIEYFGRRDQQVKIRGQKVVPEEVELALTRLPQVHAAAVKAVAIAGRTLLAAYVACPQPWPEISTLRRALTDSLPDYMVPSFFTFLDRIPLTASGKMDRHALPDPVPAADRGDLPPEERPQGKIEEQLAGIWESVLKVSLIGRNDDFFSLGGDSLAAAHIQASVEKELQTRIPLAAFIGASTIAEQAVLVQEKTGLWHRLIPLKKEGSGPPLFVIPPAGATVLAFAGLARHLPPDLRVYGLQPWGTEGESSPHYSVRKMARAYIEEIQKVAPDGPYLLAGMCFGGLVVYEMARQLEKMGEPVALAAVLDTLLPPNLPFNIRMLGVYRLVRRSLRTGRFITEGQVIRLRQQFADHTRLRAEDLPTLNRVFRANAIARYTYFAGPLDGKIHLLFSQANSPNYRRMAWEKLASRVEITRLHGEHTGPSSILQEPNVRILADQLAAMIAACLLQTGVETGAGNPAPQAMP